MKKLLCSLSFFALSLFAFAGTDKYKVNDAAVDQMFAQSQDISLSLVNEVTVLNLNQSVLKVSDGQTVIGFLVRDFFCGFIGLHRVYTGSDSSDMWWKYCGTTIFCLHIPAIVDFFWVLFAGNKALDKYKGNDSFIVWF